jgi:hypothetical protein
MTLRELAREALAALAVIALWCAVMMLLVAMCA